MSLDGQRTKRRGNIAENFKRLSKAHECSNRQTDGRATAYSEREGSLEIIRWMCFAKVYI